ncbi:hypothetical protein M3210_15320 [Oceanobacillus luteolus]|uniref:hypothetical protein n=1 Tax=Oceanobacillus luteolus TaxID=1274358 RepID=UPI0020414831|nr:hypothetical protein [Oceanobacillus luteolus]MCM3741622.1 hypothetical protein [Oceanobacillus luteolus]
MMLFLEKFKNKLKEPEFITFDNLSTTFFDSNNWFYQPSLIDFSLENNALQLKANTSKNTYVNFWEGHTSFSTIEERHNKITLHPQNSILIEGKVTQTLDYNIYLIEYDENNQQAKKHNIRLNTLTTIVPAPNTKAARLTIRVAGNGKMEISKIFTSPFIPVKRKVKSSIRHLNNLEIAGVLSHSSVIGLSAVTQINRLDTYEWKKVIEKTIPDFVLLEAGEIISEEWGKLEDHTSPIGRLLLWCETSNIPVILWHKQPSIEVERFIGLLSHVEFVLTHDAKQYEMYKSHADTPSVFLIPYTTSAPPVNFFKKHPTVVVITEKAKEHASSDPTLPITVRYIEAADNIDSQVEEQLSQGNLVVCNQSLLHTPDLKDFVQEYISEADLQELLESLQELPEQAAEKYREVTRTILWKHNYRDFLDFIVKKFNMEHATKLPTATMICPITSDAEYQNTIRTIEKQSLKNISWVFFITPFHGYEEVINQYIDKDNFKVYIGSYAISKYSLQQFTKSTYFGILDSSQEYDEFFIEDHINTMYYYRLTSLVDHSVRNRNQIFAKFFLTSKYNHHPLQELMEEFIPVKEKMK